MKRPTARRVDRELLQRSPVDWDRRYETEGAPWRSKGIGPVVRRYLRYCPTGSRLLEIGYGLGDDALELIDLGFDYSGIECSFTASMQAAQRLQQHPAKLVIGDFFTWDSKQRYAVIYDKGVFHGLVGRQRRLTFSRRVAGLLERCGFWITVCGSADDYDPRNPRGVVHLTQLVEAVEPFFEIVYLEKAVYELKRRASDFSAWFGVFRRLEPQTIWRRRPGRRIWQ